MDDLLIAVRALHFASTAIASGAVIFHAIVTDPVRRRMGRIQRRYFSQGMAGLRDR